jgi:CheY-like chemotaxis protein
LSKLSANNIQQLIHKGDVDIEGLLFKVKLMLGNEPKLQVQSSKLQVPKSNFKPETRKQEPKTGLPKVLIIEDNKDNMTTIKAILKGKYTITEAFDGEQGLALALSGRPDIILLDMSLPKMSGQQMIETLKSNLETKNIPIIIVTAQAMMGDKEHFLATGCDGYVSKPIDQVILLKEISKFVIG